MSILHIFKNTNEKFFEPFIEFVNSSFDKKNHLFMIQGPDNRNNKVVRDNVRFVTNIQYFNLIKEMYKSENIILHALMSPTMVLILFLQPWLLKKCKWVIWGSDLYYHIFRKKNLKSAFYEFMRKVVISNMGGLITFIKGEYKLAQEWYNAKCRYYNSFMYPSNLYREYDVSRVKKEDCNKVYIQIGNSADPSNNHMEILHKLESIKDENIEIICPLSYGNIEYRDNVTGIGRKMFGDKFNPLIEFMPFSKYLELLARIDIAIFNHARQQGMGNIITLLGLGKKVYIRDDITTWDFCIEHGLKVYKVNTNLYDLTEKMLDEEINNNIEIIRTSFSKEKLAEDLMKIFDEVFDIA